MKNFKILLITIFIFSCSNNKSKDIKSLEDKKTFQLLEKHIDSLKLVHDSCANYFTEAFIKYGVWEKEVSILESTMFYPKKGELQNMRNRDQGVFLSFLLSYNEEKILECYFYDSLEKDFKPLHIKEQFIEKDSNFLVRLYLNNGFYCNDIFLEGSKSPSESKNGVFKRQY